MSAKKHNRKNDKDQDVKLQIPDPERLHDINHRMNKLTNDVQGEVSYDENTRQGNQDSHLRKETQWKNIQSDYRKKYPNITDEDLDYESGDFDNMTGRIAKRTNRNREDVNNEIRDWNHTL
ncbi:MAG: hypothetical protein ACOH2D_12040 [Gelidibacter sp.]|uniref:hypothetical protein n=1 Tax=Gelidibacter sp. TaxID=2018083 RepID=UPI0032670DD2